MDMKTKMATPARERESRLHNSKRVKGLAAMTIDTIEAEMLTQEERDQLAKDTRRWKRMSGGAHLQDWLAFGPSLMVLRRVAMRIANVNAPEGRGYTTAMGQLMHRHGLDTMDKTSITAVLWLHQPEHAKILREEVLGTEENPKLKPGQLARLNSPITARQRVERILKDRLGAGGAQDKDQRDPNMPAEKIIDLKKQVTRLSQEVAVANHMSEHLWDGLHSYCRDAPEEDVTDALIKYMTPEKVQAVCLAALKALGLTVTVKASDGEDAASDSARRKAAKEARRRANREAWRNRKADATA